jgi:phosphate transport system substrate-binding protein
MMPMPRPSLALATAMILTPHLAAAAPEERGSPSAAPLGHRPEEAARASLRLNGAASVVDSLVRPHAPAVERATGLRLAVDRSNAGKGLKDLVEGRCDIALASASLEATIDAARSAGLTGGVPDLRMHVIATSEVVFIVHPSNAARALTWEQLRDIHTGAITNWKQVGGADLPIVVFTDAAASATRGLVRQVVMGGADYGRDARALAKVSDVNEQVARTPGGVGGLGLEFVDPARVAVVRTRKVERPLAFVTVGAPGTDATRVIEAYRVESRRAP